MRNFPKPPFDDQKQELPGTIALMKPAPDHGEQSYQGSGKLRGKRALITGGDSGIGRAIAIAFVREGADVAIAYFEDGDDARDTLQILRESGGKVTAYEGDLDRRETASSLVDHAIAELGGLDIIVNNAAHQATFDALEEIDDDEWERTFSINLHAMFRIVRAALPHLGEGSAIINTTSINADKPNPSLLAYATSKGAIQNFTSGLAQMLAEKGIRVNCVAPGPVWTPLIPATMPAEEVRSIGEQTPFKRPAQPVELAPVYVMLASDEASYVSGATVAVTGGAPML